MSNDNKPVIGVIVPRNGVRTELKSDKEVSIGQFPITRFGSISNLEKDEIAKVIAYGKEVAEDCDNNFSRTAILRFLEKLEAGEHRK